MKVKFLMMAAAAMAMTACECKDSPNSGADGVGAGVGTGPTAEAFAAETNHRVYFGFDQYSLTPTGRKNLENQADWLKEHTGVHVEVQGYCDKRGPIPYNDRLGLRRADAAKAYLTTLGISSSRIETITYGNRVTLVPGDTEEIYAENRVAITIAK